MATTPSEAYVTELAALRQAERSLLRALQAIGSRRTSGGYPGVRIHEALQETRAAIRLMDAHPTQRRTYDRLARGHR